ncbi:alkaline phosphatase D family protein [Aquimarina sp. 2201CG5-10]|uniref:alkaline phosphatase D family protein n=1 Tax=Aquimarina callyspongiae TaxID=3098150 RepID=UPI002AB4DB7A|nr:alkaline phosphatase D family protein [Aquimarina sp. 2201CG5-10]MDY8137672.1 alkaline phosphatase D family protein [Aquimarina sp. 2201CG5-10]
MKIYCITLLLLLGCLFQVFSQENENIQSDYTIAFGSCNKQDKPQPFWNEIIKLSPNLFIWGGDNIYGDSEDMTKIANDYNIQNSNSDYQKLKKSTPILATWDDHDYGKNDAGGEWKLKKESQQLFLDFLGVPKKDPRRKQEGVYNSKVFETEKGSIKIIVLDTRYFRSPLQESEIEGKRFEPYENGEGTILGEAQWKWLEKELETNYSDFIIIVSSIQFLSSEHGFETWGNFPHEVSRLKNILINKAVRNAIILSGDRHISEFSIAKVKGLKYPLVDFTSSGLTHSYTSYNGESNRYRIGRVISIPSFGLLKFNFDTNEVIMQIRGEKNVVLQELRRKYPKD